MRLRTFILTALVVNLALLAGVVFQFSLPAKVVGKRNGQVASATNIPESTTNISIRLVTVPSATKIETFRWDDVESDDYLQLAENLRGIGCPPDTVRDIVIGRAKDDYADQVWELQKPMQAALWDYLAKGIEIDDWPLDKQMIERYEQLSLQRGETMKLLAAKLGKRREPEDMPEGDRWSSLPEEMRPAIREIYEKYSDIRRELVEREEVDDEPKKVRDRLRNLDSERNAELRTLVGDDRWDEYLLRGSENARWIRSLPGLKVAEEEMREFARRRDVIDQQKKEVAKDDPDREQKLARLDAQRAVVLTEVLGAERAGHVERQRSADYLTFRNIVRRHGLPRDIANRLYEVQQVAQKNARELMASEVPDPELRAQAAKAILLNTQSEIMGIIGEQAWPTMQKYGMGWYDKLFDTE